MDKFKNNSHFKEAFIKRGFPYKLETGIKEFIIGSELKIVLDFNPEFFNLFPRLKLLLNNEKETEVFNIGSGFGNRYIYSEITPETLEESFQDIQNLIDDVDTFASRLSLKDLSKDIFHHKVTNIFQRNNFINS